MVGAEKAMPQLLAWNSGTTGSIVSLADVPSASLELAISECRTLERCEYSTPLGSPVVPEVEHIAAAVFSSQAFPSNVPAASAHQPSHARAFFSVVRGD